MYLSKKEIRGILESNETENLFDGNDYERGQIEAVERSSSEAGEGLSKLLKILIKKNILTIDETIEFVSSIKVS